MRFTAHGVFISMLALVMAPTVVSAISLTDYKFPQSTSQQAYLNGSFTSNDANDAGQVGYNLVGTGSYDFVHRSLPLKYEMHGLANAASARPDTAGIDSKGSYRLDFNAKANKYIRDESNVFTYGRTNFAYRALTGASPDDPFWDVAAGVGVGRTIDATVLRQALRMQEDFQKYGILKADIPDDALLELAGIIDREDEYRTRYGSVEYRKYWYEDMEEAVRKSGALKGDALGAMGVIRIEEVLKELTGRRYYGWEARAGLGVVVSDFSGNNGDPILEAAFDWARPAGMQLQFTNNASLTGTFADDPFYTLKNAFQLYYEVSNHIDWDNRATVTYDIPTATGLDNVMRLDLSSTYRFYIENRLTFTPSITYTFEDPGAGSNAWGWVAFAGIEYRLK